MLLGARANNMEHHDIKDTKRKMLKNVGEASRKSDICTKKLGKKEE